MRDEPWVAILIGSFLAIWGTMFAVFRRRISRRAIAQRREFNKGRGVKLQAPWILGLAGIVFAIVGVALLISGIIRAIG